MRSRIVDKSVLLKFIGSPAPPATQNVSVTQTKDPVNAGYRANGKPAAVGSPREPACSSETATMARANRRQRQAWARTPSCIAAVDGACRRCGGCHAEQLWQARNGSASIVN